MEQTVRDVMTANPVSLEITTNAAEAARFMRDNAIGDVLVVDGSGAARGIVTDRDIVVRVVAEGRDPADVTLDDIASVDLTTIQPGAPAEEAVDLMRKHAVRRLPVVEDDRPVGIVSIGDLAVERDPTSALADISASPPNS